MAGISVPLRPAKDMDRKIDDRKMFPDEGIAISDLPNNFFVINFSVHPILKASKRASQSGRG
jgi:hypothetical protein